MAGKLHETSASTHNTNMRSLIVPPLSMEHSFAQKPMTRVRKWSCEIIHNTYIYTLVSMKVADRPGFHTQGLPIKHLNRDLSKPPISSPTTQKQTLMVEAFDPVTRLKGKIRNGFVPSAFLVTLFNRKGTGCFGRSCLLELSAEGRRKIREAFKSVWL